MVEKRRFGSAKAPENGALAGFTLVLQNSRLVAAAGLITMIAASMSMSTSRISAEVVGRFGGR